MLGQIYNVFLQGIDKINSIDFFKSFTDNRFYLILLVVFFLHLKNATYRSMIMCALINIPGTILHELMHFIVGLVLNAQPRNFSIIPKRSDGGYVMGSVSFANIAFYNAVPASMAPLLLLPLGFYVNRYLLPLIEPTFLNYVLYVWMQTIIIENAMPSKADFKVAKMYFSGVVLYSLLAV